LGDQFIGGRGTGPVGGNGEAKGFLQGAHQLRPRGAERFLGVHQGYGFRLQFVAENQRQCCAQITFLDDVAQVKLGCTGLLRVYKRDTGTCKRSTTERVSG
jgi:hypothetical protein